MWGMKMFVLMMGTWTKRKTETTYDGGVCTHSETKRMLRSQQKTAQTNDGEAGGGAGWANSLAVASLHREERAAAPRDLERGK
jgi:hypothetical protein